MKAVIRAATPDDLNKIINMGREFFEQSGFAEVTTWDEDTFLRTAAMLLVADEGSLLVVEQHGQIVGMAGSVIFPFFMNANQRIGQELFWWVSPDYRNGVGTTLLEELERDAKRKGADVFMTAQIAGHRDGAFKRLYMQRGYRPAENSFVRRLS
jgi:ribosomal protein S18 acetylase RimI-like enzyme